MERRRNTRCGSLSVVRTTTPGSGQVPRVPVPFLNPYPAGPLGCWSPLHCSPKAVTTTSPFLEGMSHIIGQPYVQGPGWLLSHPTPQPCDSPFFP